MTTHVRRAPRLVAACAAAAALAALAADRAEAHYDQHCFAVAHPPRAEGTRVTGWGFGGCQFPDGGHIPHQLVCARVAIHIRRADGSWAHVESDGRKTCVQNAFQVGDSGWSYPCRNATYRTRITFEARNQHGVPIHRRVDYSAPAQVRC